MESNANNRITDSNTVYSRFESTELILRDELAIDRTMLANERTLLAYLRSSFALLIAGVSIMHFAEHTWFWSIGLICIPSGIITGIIGVARFLKMKRAIGQIRKNNHHPKGRAATDQKD